MDNENDRMERMERERIAGIKGRCDAGFESADTDEIVCPWCGIEWSDSCDEIFNITMCDECGGEFSFERAVVVTYATAKEK